MQAKDIVATQVIVVPPEATTREIAALLLERRISAVPVIQPDGGLVGIVSEGDLMRCPETGAERHPSLVARPAGQSRKERSRLCEVTWRTRTRRDDA